MRGEMCRLRADPTIVKMAFISLRRSGEWSALVLVDDRNGPMTRSDRVATLEEPRRSFKRAGTPGRRGRSWKR